MEPISDPPASKPLSVGALNRLVKEAIEGSLPSLLVEGELSRVTRAASGHVYFTLKDDEASVSAVLWGSTARTVSMDLQEGLRVVVRAQPTLYPPRGAFQIVCQSIRPAGEGAIRAAFLKLQARLKEEGLLDPARKRPLPSLPACVGVVTSPTGAAIEDIKRSIWNRFPAMPIVLCPVRVQGVHAAREICDGIRRLNAARSCDVMIVGRGGGSVEDLAAFNDEALARAIAASRIPVVSAVGHEIDISIADLVADARALTPTAAGALVVPVFDDLLSGVELLASRGRRAAARALQASSARIQDLLRRARRRQLPRRLEELRQSIDDRRLAARRALRSRFDGCRLHALLLRDRLHRRSGRELLRLRADRLAGVALRLRQTGCPPLRRARDRLLRLSASLGALNPLAVLDRGFAVVRRAGDGKIVQGAGSIATGDLISVTFARGADLLARAEGTRSRTGGGTGGSGEAQRP